MTGKKIVNLPNMLTIFRMFMIIPFVFSFLKDEYFLSVTILCMSGITDLLDGTVARKTGQTTRLGAILDPFADKLTLISAIICLSFKFSGLAPFVGVLLAKDLAMLIVGGIFLMNGIDPPAARWYGKVSTVLFYFSAVSLVFFSKICLLDCTVLSLVLFSVTTSFMLFSLLKYFFLCLKILRDSGSVS